MIPGLGRSLAILAAFLASFVMASCAAPPPRGTFARGYTPPDPPPIPDRKPIFARNTQLAAGSIQQITLAAKPAVQASTKPQASTKKALLADASPKLIELPTYLVRPKDTVYAISRRFDVPIRGLIDYNALAPPYTLSIGQRLRIPVKRQHTVTKGETVYGISRAYGVDLTEFVRLNRLGAPYTIKPAQFLVVPVPPLTAVATAPAGTTPQSAGDSTGAGQKGRQIANAPARPTPKAIPQPPPRGGSKFLWPVKGQIVLGFGPKGNGRHNDGINIKAPRGAPVRAADNGVVAYTGNQLRGFGNLLLIKHSGGWVTAYAHTDKVLVSRGQTVKRGQTIGQVGTTGNVSSPQLHFEVRKGTRAVNPAGLLGPVTANLN